MTRIFGHYVSPEMILLWLVELVLCFLAFSILLALPATDNAAIWSLRTAGLAAILALTFGATSVAGGLYQAETCCELRRMVVNTMIVGVLALLAISTVVGLDVGHRATHDLGLATILLAWVVCLVLTRVAFHMAMRQDLFIRRIVVIGSERVAHRVSEAATLARGPFFEVVETFDARRAIPSPDQLRQRKIRGIVVTAGARSSIGAAELLRCKCQGIWILNDVEFCERQLKRVDIDNLNPDWLAFAEGFSCYRLQSVLRRLGDLLISFTLLLFVLPLMLLTALLVKLDSRGPILYRQERVGLYGKTFMLFKFRSMMVDAEAGRGPAWAVKNDPRATRVGRFIRLMRIDELPQLINVLKGEMSLIGPRPERPHFVAQLSEAIPSYSSRHWVKPGITGWSQVNFPYGASVEDARMKLSYDLFYLKHRGLFLDFLILVSTIRTILFQEGSR
jgi:sugar transferase (PEP-CTERM system associated)